MAWNWHIDGWIVLVGILSACSCALPGNYLVLRKLSLMGDAISHAVLPGLAIAFILTGSRASWPMFVGAVAVGGLTALLTEAITRHGKVEHGAAMGVVFSILFAIGLILIRRAADHVDLDPGCVLYGNIVQVPLDAIGTTVPPVVVNLSIVLGLNALFVGLFYKELKIASFDPALATTLGINASAMHYALMVVVAITTVANFEAVGSILVIAMLIVPGVTAHLLTDRLGVMIALSLGVAVASAVAGHVLAAAGPGWVGIDASANTAAMMAVVAGGLLTLAVLLAPQQGVLSRLYQQAALSRQIIRQDILGLLYRWRELYAGEERAMPGDHLLAAVGDTRRARWALWQLRRRGQVEVVQAPPGHGKREAVSRPERAPVLEGGGRMLRLTPAGVAEAAQLVGSHRLWESFLDRHFDLAPDHLHAPAERVEHYITPEMRDQLRRQLTDPEHDPHGKPIPRDADRS